MQSILLPLLINPDRAEPNAGQIFRSMMSMSPSSTESLIRSLDDPAASTIGRRSPPATGRAPSAPASEGSGFPDNAPGQAFGISTHAPAAAADFRIQLLRGGNLTDSRLAQIEVHTVVVSSARDRLLPSMREGAPLSPPSHLTPHWHVHAVAEPWSGSTNTSN